MKKKKRKRKRSGKSSVDIFVFPRELLTFGRISEQTFGSTTVTLRVLVESPAGRLKIISYHANNNSSTHLTQRHSCITALFCEALNFQMGDVDAIGEPIVKVNEANAAFFTYLASRQRNYDDFNKARGPRSERGGIVRNHSAISPFYY